MTARPMTTMKNRANDFLVSALVGLFFALAVLVGCESESKGDGPQYTDCKTYVKHMNPGRMEWKECKTS